MKHEIQIDFASVKVMRSYDYCHFEVNLSASIETGQGAAAVDELRKTAARLADKAVEQYKASKLADERLAPVKAEYVLHNAEATPEDQRTPQQKAIIKYHSDSEFRSRFDYDYQDDYEQWDGEN